MASITLVNGTNGNDTLDGSSSSSNDQFNGLLGDDILNANGLGGVLYGGAGVDTFNINNGDYRIYDFVAGETINVAADATARLTVGSSRVLDLSILSSNVTNGGLIVATGTTGNDTITGSGGEDSILGGAGNDSVSGGADDDKLYGEAGNDKLQGDAGGDTLDGGIGNDTLTGGSGDDYFIVNSGSDTITDFGLDDDDLVVAKGATANVTVTVYGLDSDLSDIQNAGTVNLYLKEAAAVDLSYATGVKVDGIVVGTEVGYKITAAGNASGSNIIGSNFTDTIIGGNNNDSIDGGDGGNDLLTGGLGDDEFDVNADIVTITDFGKGADDLYVASDATANVTVVANFKVDSDTVNYGTANLTMASTATSLSLADADTDADTVGYKVTTSSKASTVIGSGDDDTIIGGTANDSLSGGDGDDLINGGAGIDTMVGGDGDDTYFVDDVKDAVYEDKSAGAGTEDTVYSSILNYTLAGNVENLTLIGTGYDIAAGKYGKSATNGNGNDLDNTLTGNDGINLLNGAAGDDTLIGGKGADVLTGGAGVDMFTFSAGDSGQVTGFDKIQDYAGGSDLIYCTDGTLAIGGTDDTATKSQASIDQDTGIATFATGSGINMTDALADISVSLGTGGDLRGEFALFQVNKTGTYYLFISDGVVGVTANDVVVQLVGVTSTTGGTVDVDGYLTIKVPSPT